MEYLEENLRKVREDIRKAALKSGRKEEEITLVAVTKTVLPEVVRESLKFGISVLGENKVQEALVKKKVINEPLMWHMIGHLQTNKVKAAVALFDMIHSVDSLKLALEIDKRSAQSGKVMDILLEVNIAQEGAKFGLAKSEVIPLLKEMALFEHLKVKGLMTMAPFAAEEDIIRKTFKELKLLKDDIIAENIEKVSMEYLSMGMSQDYTIAIEEGSTMVRIGSAIFGRRKYE